MARRGDGLALRGRTWWLDFHHQGQRYKVRIGKNISRSAASEIATVQRARILKEEVGVGKKRKDIEFDVARDKFLEDAEVNTRPRTLRSYREYCSQLSASFSGKRLSKISVVDVERHKWTRAKGGARVRANREIQCLRNIFNFCLRQRPAIYEGINPAITGKGGIKKLKESEGRTITIDTTEEAKLVAHSDEVLRGLVIVGLNTGVRIQAEGLALEWPHVDFRRRTLTVEGAYSKNHRTRVIPLNKPAVEALEGLKATSRGPYVFSQSNGERYQKMDERFRAVVKAAGLSGKGITLHCLRHTWATRMVESGCDLRSLMELGGWGSLQMVTRYTHPGHFRAAVERLEALQQAHALEEFHPAIPPSVLSAV
jgi:integrase